MEAHSLLGTASVHTVKRSRDDIATRKMHPLELDDLLRSARPIYYPLGSRRPTRRMRAYRFRALDRAALVAEAPPPKRWDMVTVKIPRVKRQARRRISLATLLTMISVLLATWFLS